MSFNSISFLFFFPIVALIYYIIPHKIRWFWLLLTSYYFYMSWNPKYAILIFTSTIVTYLSGLLINNANKSSNMKKAKFHKKIYVILSLSINLGILFMFKYYNFFFHKLTWVLLKFHIGINMPSFDYMLPVGISFYTFQAISYTIDVYKNDSKAINNFGKYALFVAFFPQLIAGPIEKSKNILPQLEEKHKFDYERVKNGLLLMLWGLFQKIVIADRLSKLVNTVFSKPSSYHGFEIFIASIFFTLEIYCDFSGYSDMARGVSEVLGFRLSKNFERPYFSKSIKEFWRRWHITLGAWFRDYLYIPLGGNRCRKYRYYLNIMIVFIVSGLWHGAATTFIVWGALHGSYQVIGNILKPIKRNVINIFNIKTEVFSYKLYQVIITFFLVDVAWIFFRATSVTDALIMIKNMIYFNPWVLLDGSIFKLGLDKREFLLSLITISIFMLVSILQINRNIRFELAKQNIVFRWSIYITAIMFIMVFGVYGADCSSQQFIYAHF